MADEMIPAHVDEITAEWLNEVLASSDDIGTIESIELEHFGEGVGILGELARISPTYATGSDGPATFIAKCPAAAEENHFLAIAMGFYVREVNFYRELAGDIDIRVPKPYYTATSESGVPFVILIEDIHGARTPDQIEGLSVEEARKIISTIVPLHAQYWGKVDELDALPWLLPMNNDRYKGGQEMAQALYPAFKEHFADKLPTSFLDRISEACDRYIDMLDYVVTVGQPTFTHTDCRAENYLFGGPDGDDAVTVIDFQLSTRHIGMWDVTNLITGSMTIELRRANEMDLIAHYVDEVVSRGIEYSMEQAVKEYRVCLLQQCPAQVIVSDLSGGNDRGNELLEQLHLRPLSAAVDNDALSVLDDF